MIESFRRSVALAKASFNVLRADRELLVFPLVSFAVLAVVTAGFFVPLWLTGALTRTAQGSVDPIAIVVGFVYYVVAYTVMFFFNTALVGAALIRLDGGDPTLADGFGIARRRLPAIVGYAVMAATVGMLLRAISERAGVLGQIVVGLIGLAWNVATFLVVPVLVVEEAGPIDAIKRSSSLLRRTWGEQIVGNVGISLVFGLMAVGVIALGLVVIAALWAVSPVLAVGGVVILVLAVGGVLLVGAALSGIFTASVYRYATKGDGGPLFPREALASTFERR